MPNLKREPEGLSEKTARFFRDLVKLLGETPEIRIDLSDPHCCGMLRIAERTENQNGEKSAALRYAMIPSENGQYTDPEPDDEEERKKWKLMKQFPIDIGENGEILTGLTTAQLEYVQRCAREGRLCTVCRNASYGGFSDYSLIQLKVDEERGLILNHIPAIPVLKAIKLGAEAAEVFASSSDFSPEPSAPRSEEENLLADAAADVDEEEVLFWEASSYGFPPLTKEQIRKGKAIIASDCLKLFSAADLSSVTLIRNGKEGPLLEPEETERMSGAVYQRSLLAGARIYDALNAGEDIRFVDRKGFFRKLSLKEEGDRVLLSSEKLGLCPERKAEMNRFFADLKEKLSAAHPSVDLSDPKQLGRLQIVDIRNAEENGASDDRAPEEIGETKKVTGSRCTARIRYAAMAHDGKEYRNPPPDKNSDDYLKWLVDSQFPISLGEKGEILSDLDEDQLYGIFEAAEEGRLTVAEPGSSVSAGDHGGFSVIRTDPENGVSVTGIGEIREKAREDKTESEARLIEGLDALYDETQKRKRDVLKNHDPAIRCGAAADDLFEPYFWKSESEGLYVLSRDEIFDSLVFDEEKPADLQYIGEKALTDIMVIEGGEAVPAFDPEFVNEITGGAEKNPGLYAAYVGSRLAASAKKGNLFYKGENGSFRQLVLLNDPENGKPRYSSLALSENEGPAEVPFRIRFARFFKKDAYQQEFDRISTFNRRAEFRAAMRGYAAENDAERRKSVPDGIGRENDMRDEISLADKASERQKEKWDALSEEQKNAVRGNLLAAKKCVDDLKKELDDARNAGEGAMLDPKRAAECCSYAVIDKLLSNSDSGIMDVLSEPGNFSRFADVLLYSEPFCGRFFAPDGVPKQIPMKDAARLLEADNRFLLDVIADLPAAYNRAGKQKQAGKEPAPEAENALRKEDVKIKETGERDVHFGN